MATRDIEFAAKYVDQCMMLFDGTVIMNDAPKRIFLAATSFIQHLLIDSFEKELPYALTWEDVYEACPNDMLHS